MVIIEGAGFMGRIAWNLKTFWEHVQAQFWSGMYEMSQLGFGYLLVGCFFVIRECFASDFEGFSFWGSFCLCMGMIYIYFDIGCGDLISLGTYWASDFF